MDLILLFPAIVGVDDAQILFNKACMVLNGAFCSRNSENGSWTTFKAQYGHSQSE